jgi:hypothetical protein
MWCLIFQHGIWVIFISDYSFFWDVVTLRLRKSRQNNVFGCLTLRIKALGSMKTSIKIEYFNVSSETNRYSNVVNIFLS